MKSKEWKINNQVRYFSLHAPKNMHEMGFFWHQFDIYRKKIPKCIEKHFLKAGYFAVSSHIIIISSKSRIFFALHAEKHIAARPERIFIGKEFSQRVEFAAFYVQRQKTALFMILWIAKSLWCLLKHKNSINFTALRNSPRGNVYAANFHPTIFHFSSLEPQ